MSPRLFCTMACQHASTIHRICNFQTWLLSSGQQRKLEVTNFRAHCDAVVLIIQRAGCKLPGSTWAPCFSPKTTAEYNGSKRIQTALSKSCKGWYSGPRMSQLFPHRHHPTPTLPGHTTRWAAKPGATTAASGSRPTSSGRWEFSSSPIRGVERNHPLAALDSEYTLNILLNSCTSSYLVVYLGFIMAF